MKAKNLMLGTAVGVGLITAGAALYYKMRSTIPSGVKAVAPFNAKKYLGKWHEVARLDYIFEKGLDNVMVEYSLNKDGSVKVVNSGYDYKKGKRMQAAGKAKFVYSPDIAMLRVSFHGPLYAGYNVIAIDKDYKYALVAGRNFDYLWFLSRDVYMPEDVKKDYIQKAKDLGYNTDKLIWSEHKK